MRACRRHDELYLIKSTYANGAVMYNAQVRPYSSTPPSSSSVSRLLSGSVPFPPSVPAHIITRAPPHNPAGAPHLLIDLDGLRPVPGPPRTEAMPVAILPRRPLCPIQWIQS